MEGDRELELEAEIELMDCKVSVARLDLCLLAQRSQDSQAEAE